jgi:hypothetical protein
MLCASHSSHTSLAPLVIASQHWSRGQLEAFRHPVSSESEVNCDMNLFGMNKVGHYELGRLTNYM